MHIYCVAALLGPLAMTLESNFDAYLLYFGSVALSAKERRERVWWIFGVFEK